MNIKKAMVVKIPPLKVWIESGMFGEKFVMLQHEGCELFEYAAFNCHYLYTTNDGTRAAAECLARSLGATDPIEHKTREFGLLPTEEELLEQIASLTEALAEIRAARVYE